jgi:hypothetical protein
MKIIQLLAAIDGESPGTIGSQIYGLSDSGDVYELVSPSAPRTPKNYGGQPLGTYYDGATGGWKLICQSHERSEVIPNPDRP